MNADAIGLAKAKRKNEVFSKGGTWMLKIPSFNSFVKERPKYPGQIRNASELVPGKWYTRNYRNVEGYWRKHKIQFIKEIDSATFKARNIFNHIATNYYTSCGLKASDIGLWSPCYLTEVDE